MKSIRKHHGHMISLTKTLIMSLKRPIFLSLTTLSFTLIGLSSLGIFFLEAELNPQIIHGSMLPIMPLPSPLGLDLVILAP